MEKQPIVLPLNLSSILIVQYQNQNILNVSLASKMQDVQHLVNTSSWYDKEKKVNNTKDTINGDKERFLVTESFVDPGPSEPGARGSLPQPQTFGRYVKILISGRGRLQNTPPSWIFRPSYGSGMIANQIGVITSKTAQLFL